MTSAGKAMQVMVTCQQLFQTGLGGLALRVRVVLGWLCPTCAGHSQTCCPCSPSLSLRKGPQQGWGSWSPCCPCRRVPAGCWHMDLGPLWPSALSRGQFWVGAWNWLPSVGDPGDVPQDPGQKVQSQLGRGVLPAGDPGPWRPQHTSILSCARSSPALI